MKNSKRILSVTIKRMIDDSPDTSWLGEYSNTRTSEFSIDRKHSEDCASVSPVAAQAKTTLDHAAEYLASLWDGAPDTQNSEETDAAIETLQTFADEVIECDCGERGDMERHEYRYFNPSFNYVDASGNLLPEYTAEEVRKYVAQDYARMESLNRGDWSYLCLCAEAQIGIPSRSFIRTQRITSGCGGIESDCNASDFAEIEADQLAELKDQLLALGFSKRAIATAFKDVEHKDA